MHTESKSDIGNRRGRRFKILCLSSVLIQKGPSCQMDLFHVKRERASHHATSSQRLYSAGLCPAS